MAIARQISHANRHTASASPTITFPGTWTPAEDDLVLLFCQTTNTTSINADPTGWVNTLGSGTVVTPGDTTCYMAAMYHWVTAGEESGGTLTYTIPTLWVGNEDNQVVGVVYRGVDTTDPIMAATSGSNASNTTAHEYPAVGSGDIDADDGVVVACVGADGASTYTNPSGWTQLQTVTATDPGTHCAERDTLTTSGVGVSATTVTSSLSGEYVAITVALRPAAGGGGTQTLEPPAIASTASLFAPIIVAGAVTLSMPAIASTSTLHAPAVTPGAVAVAPPAITATSTLHTPTITVGAVTVSLPTIASTASLAAPTVTPGAVTIEPPTIASTAQLHAPTVTASDTLAPPHIASIASLHAPTVAPGPVSMALPTIASAAAIYAPVVGDVGAVTPDDRTVTVAADTRTVTVTASSRTVTVAADSRTTLAGD